MLTSGVLVAFFLGSVFIGRNFLHEKHDEEWSQFKINFNKTYKSPREETLRRGIFMKNLKIIQTHNSKNESSFKLGINQFSDMTFKEFQDINEPVDISLFDFADLIEPDAHVFKSYDIEVPDSFDWRDKGVVTSVRDQKVCGACYGFATLSAIESQIVMRQNKSFELSTQELMDCGSKHGLLDCMGGVLSGVFSYINSMNGLSLEKNYPFKGIKEECQNLTNRVELSVKAYWSIESQSERALQEALFLHGPVVVLFDCLHDLFSKYSSGIYYDDECISLGAGFIHAALVVGYGSENGTDFWTLKNSWGEKWGEAGYFRIARNKDFHCEIGRFGLIPILD